LAWPEAACIVGADLPEPELGIRMTREQSIGSNELLSIELVITRFNIDDGELALVFGSDVRQDISVVDLISTPGELFFAISRCRGHDQLPEN
jgi:hypothetical protein